ncbi:MAG: tRNA pseudouridine(55) synthase TruB [Desulfovibrio sp.]|nr:tRNA pseudouridine(55) synthase TruB [Desulfovibrio sp.]
MQEYTGKPRPVKKPVLPQLDGVLAINKPSGPTSAACLNLLKRLGQKKIGHAGTLDPMASGGLIVLLGQATKLSSFIMEAGHKAYKGKLRLGLTTDTWDTQGKILTEADCSGVTPDMIKDELARCEGELEQIVPAYSAAKHNGQPLYKLARKGLPTPVKSKTIHIYKAGMLDFSMPYVTFRVICGSGSYVRSLAHSLGTRLGCGAVLSELTREYSYPCGLESALDPARIEAEPETIAENLLPLEQALPDWTRIELSSREALSIRQGRPIPAQIALPQGSMAFLLEKGKPLAIARLVDAFWTVRRGLWN